MPRTRTVKPRSWFSPRISMIFICWLLIATCHAVRDVEDTNYWRSKARSDLQTKLQDNIVTGVAKNVILFVGDGMGVSTVTSARIYTGGEDFYLSFERLPFTGMLKTYAVDKKVPDSACSATALFTGVKTNYDVTGLNANVTVADCEASLQEENQLASILKWAQDAGKSTGFVTTTRVTHATPSALYAHCPDRRWECESKMPDSARSKCKDIARQLMEDEPGINFNVIMGGGRQCLQSNVTGSPADPIDTWACYSTDGRDLIGKWKEHKAKNGLRHRFVQNTGALNDLENNLARTDYVLGVFANGHLKLDYARDSSDNGMPSLEHMTRAALGVLAKNPKGFVLVVEGGMIDQAHHRGHAAQALDETKAFDRAVNTALTLTFKEITLIVVTADHDHGLAYTGYAPREANILGIAQKSKQDDVPYTSLLYATGDKQNYQFSSQNGKVVRTDPSDTNTSAYEYSQQTGVLSDEVAHGGSDVAVYAIGPMAHLLTGVHEQNYVAEVIAYAAQIGHYSTSSAKGVGPCFTMLLIYMLNIVLGEHP